MKNTHILPTDNPSRLHYFTANKKGYYLYPNNELVIPINPNCINQHINITSDEEIKDGDWCLDKFNQKWKLKDKELIAFDSKGIKRFSTDNILGHECKKIILTTDQDLIKDGVQEIDDEFLEWFVKNPNCEEVVVAKMKIFFVTWGFKYKIIIPKQKTLEEAAKKHATNHGMMSYISPEKKESFIEGAKLQQERNYSEEEVLKLLNEINNPLALLEISVEEWFEQFKKK
jgi:hypothetical protein